MAGEQIPDAQHYKLAADFTHVKYQDFDRFFTCVAAIVKDAYRLG
jgi:hypothetical protein